LLLDTATQLREAGYVSENADDDDEGDYESDEGDESGDNDHGDDEQYLPDLVPGDEGFVYDEIPHDGDVFASAAAFDFGRCGL
jgi:hypothetical protein